MSDDIGEASRLGRNNNDIIIPPWKRETLHNCNIKTMYNTKRMMAI